MDRIERSLKRQVSARGERKEFPEILQTQSCVRTRQNRGVLGGAPLLRFVPFTFNPRVLGLFDIREGAGER